MQTIKCMTGTAKIHCKKCYACTTSGMTTSRPTGCSRITAIVKQKLIDQLGLTTGDSEAFELGWTFKGHLVQPTRNE